MNQQLRDLIEVKKSGINYLSKWHVLDTPSKLETVKDNKLYAGFSSDFNDVFDAQIRMTNNYVQKLHDHLLTNPRVRNITSQLKKDVDLSDYFIDDMLKMILRLSSTNLTCFSSNDALLFESSHMWGLYGNSGAGIALQYSIDAIINKVSQCSIYESADIFKVNYKNNFSQEILNLYKDAFILLIPEPTASFQPSAEHINKIVEYSINFFCTKDIQWQHENEYRLAIPNQYSKADSRSLCVIQSDFIKYKENKDHCKFDFIKPDKIVFGWNESKRSEWEKFAYKDLEKWANEQNIECVFLSEFVNYENGKFETYDRK
jgi:hypothetical protein